MALSDKNRIESPKTNSVLDSMNSLRPKKASFWIAAALLLAHNPSTYPASCLTSVKSAFATLDQMHQKLSELPQLREFVIQAMQDPEVPPFIKLILKKSLANPDLEVIRLDDELREAWKVPDVIKGFAWGESSIALFQEPMNADGRSIIETAPGFDPQFTKSAAVVVPDGTNMAWEYPPEMVLIHELSHTIFNSVFDRAVPRMALTIPKELMRKVDGKIEIHEQLFELANELNSITQESHLEHRVGSKYFPESPTEFSITTPVKKVLDNYPITNPFVVDLAQLPVKSILLGGGKLARDQRLMEIKFFGDQAAPDSIRKPMLFKMVYAFYAKALNKSGLTQSGLLGKKLPDTAHLFTDALFDAEHNAGLKHDFLKFVSELPLIEQRLDEPLKSAFKTEVMDFFEHQKDLIHFRLIEEVDP